MENNPVISFLIILVNVLLVLLVAPFFEGVLRKVTARIQSRKGPPIIQPYLDLLKLLGKEDIDSGESPAMQRFAAYLSLGTVLTVATLVPMGMASPLGISSDVILLIYLLTLCGISTLMAGLAAGSTYSILGASREMMAMIVLEPMLAIAIIIGAIHSGSLRLEVILNGSVYQHGSIPAAGLLMLGVIIFSMQAFVGRVPFDTSEAETEIMEGPLMEYSGPKLALFKYTQMAKLFVYSSIFIAIFAPWGNTWIYPLNILLLLAKVFILVLVVTAIAATHARYRIDQVIRYYASLFGISVVALVLAIYGL